MSKINKKIKPAIYVFCEGETEIEYTLFLKEKFHSVVAIQKPVKGLFEKAYSNFNNSPKYRNYIEETDEIWFFFDVYAEQGDYQKWNDRLEIIKKLRHLQKNPNIKIRLLMTTGCVEYWLCLHYEKLRPTIKTSSDKDKILKKLVYHMSSYKKGDAISIKKIASQYEVAIKNGQWSLEQIKSESQAHGYDEDYLNEWLYKNSKTFTNVHEAIIFLESL